MNWQRNLALNTIARLAQFLCSIRKETEYLTTQFKKLSVMTLFVPPV